MHVYANLTWIFTPRPRGGTTALFPTPRRSIAMTTTLRLVHERVDDVPLILVDRGQELSHFRRQD